MARQELKKPIATLLDEKSKIDIKLTEITDRYTRFQTELQTLRYEQASYREAKEQLQNTNSNKAARRVFDSYISAAQKRIDDVVNKEIDQCEKDRVVAVSHKQAIEKSIKELQNA